MPCEAYCHVYFKTLLPVLVLFKIADFNFGKVKRFAKDSEKNDDLGLQEFQSAENDGNIQQKFSEQCKPSTLLGIPSRGVKSFV